MSIALTVTTTPIELTVTPSEGLPVSFTVSTAPAIDLTISGAMGSQGVKGDTGLTGSGVPIGGLQGYRLTKKTSGDYDTEWQAPTSNPAGNDKTIQYNDAGTLTGNDNLRFDKNSNSFIIGIPDVLPDNPLAIGNSIDGWLQANIHNNSEGLGASADWVATADNGNDLSNYIDMGINSSIYTSEDYPLLLANDAYIISESPRLVLNNLRTDSSVLVVAGGLDDTNLITTFDNDGLTVSEGRTIKIGTLNVPAVMYGTDNAPVATGLPDGTLYLKYEV